MAQSVPRSSSGGGADNIHGTPVHPRSTATAPPERRETATESAHDTSWRGLLKNTFNQWVAHKDSRLGAALAYYSVFSIGPLIVIVIAIAGLAFGADAVRAEVTGGLKGLLGDSGTKAIEGMLEGANKPHQGIIATAIGLGALVFAAIGVVVQLKDALNTVWDVKNPPAKGIWGFVRSYVLSLAGVLSLGFLLLISMLITTGLAAMGKYFTGLLPELAMQVVSFVVSFGVISLLFAMMFKWLPDVQVERHRQSAQNGRSGRCLTGCRQQWPQSW
jgi:membrane protein